jgi:hypothetical protein
LPPDKILSSGEFIHLYIVILFCPSTYSDSWKGTLLVPKYVFRFLERNADSIKVRIQISGKGLCQCLSMYLGFWKGTLSVPKYVFRFLERNSDSIKVRIQIPGKGLCQCLSMYLDF